SAAYVIDTPQSDASGPYPVFALPNRVEVVDVEAPNVTIHRKNLDITLNSSKTLTIARKDLADIEVSAFNLANGDIHSEKKNDLQLENVETGNRVVIVIGQNDIDPDSPLQLVFDRAITKDTNGLSDAEEQRFRNSVMIFKAPRKPAGALTDPEPIDVSDEF